jgi:hypothetical protein
MMLSIGMTLMLSAILLFGVAVILPKTPEVPVDRRRPYQVDAGSQLTRFAGSATDTLHRALTKRSIRMFNHEELESAGLRMSQADFFILVIAGAFVGRGALNMLVGRVPDITSSLGPPTFSAGAVEGRVIAEVLCIGVTLPVAATAGARPSAEIAAIDPNKRVAFFISFSLNFVRADCL